MWSTETLVTQVFLLVLLLPNRSNSTSLSASESTSTVLQTARQCWQSSGQNGKLGAVRAINVKSICNQSQSVTNTPAEPNSEFNVHWWPYKPRYIYHRCWSLALLLAFPSGLGWQPAAVLLKQAPFQEAFPWLILVVVVLPYLPSSCLGHHRVNPFNKLILMKTPYKKI